MEQQVRSAKSPTKRRPSFRPQVESLEQRQQPGDALISGWMTAGFLGAAVVPVTIGPAQPMGRTWAADSVAGQRHNLETEHSLVESQDHHAGSSSIAPAQTAGVGTFAEGSTTPHSFQPGEHATPISGSGAGAAAVTAGSPAAHSLSPSSSARVEPAGATNFPDALAGQVASGGHEHNLPTASPFLTSERIPLANAASLASASVPAVSAVDSSIGSVPAPSRAAHARHPATGSADLTAVPTDFSRLPLTFEANRGQADGQVQFLARESGYTVFLTGTGAVLALAPNPTTKQGNLLRLNFTGANPAAQAVGLDEQPGKVNYLHGNDPTKWQVNVPTFAQIQYQGIYPGIDLVYYGSQQQLEYDFRVAPGADPRAIQLAVTGPASPSVDAQGNLVLHTPGGDLVQHKPVIYQEGASGRQEVAGGFVVQGSQVRFAVGSYDPSRALIIDPVLSYSTYLGGSGTDVGNAVKVDAAGNVYVTGSTTSANFPTLNPFQSTYQGGTSDAFVTKLNATGTALIYSTYLGGSSDDGANALAVDANGDAYITGQTGSTNFPVTAGVVQRNFGGGKENAFVTKLNPSGSGLVYSTYVGGNDDDSAAGIAVDASGNAYITGDTTSTNYPTTASAFQRTMLGIDSGFITKLNAGGTAFVYSTYLGADLNPDGTGGNNFGMAIAVDTSGNAYVTGQTDSTGFPVTAGAFQRTFHATNNAFVTKLNASGSGLVYSSFLGGSNEDCGSGIAVDGSGNAYVVGTTDSTDFPTANPFQPTLTGNVSNAYVTKVNAAGSALVYSTYLGGSKEDNGAAIAVDAAGSAYVAGTTNSGNFPTVNAVQGTKGGGFDAWVTKFNPAGSALVYSTFLGGTGDDGVNGIALDPSLNVYVTGDTTSANFPTTPGAFQGTLGGVSNGFISKIADIHFQVTPAENVVAGTPFSVTVTALDAAGNAASGYRGTVRFSSTDAGATLPASYTFTATDAGVHTFTNGVTLVTAGSQTLTLTDGVLTGSTAVTVQAGAARMLQLTGVPSSVAAGTAFSVTVTARDQYNNVATGYRSTVTFSSTDTGATLPAAYAFTAADAGVHTFTNGVTLVTAGTQTISLTDGTLSASAMTTVQAGAATALQLTGVPTSTAAGAAFSVTITARDQNNNVATGYRGTVTFNSTDGRATLPASYTFTATDAGIHTFTNGVTLVTAGNQTLSVTDGTLNTSAAVTVQAGTATALQLTGVPANTTAGTAFSVTVTARDQYNNVATSYRGTITFSSSDARATLPATYSFTATDAGVHTFTNGVTLITAGNQTLSLTDGTLNTSTATTVQAGVAATLQLTGVPSSTVAGAAFSVTVTARDPYNNVATGYRGTISFSSTDARAALPAAYGFSAADAGVHTFTNGVTLVTAGNQTLSVTDGTLNTSAATAVQPGTATVLQLTGVPTSTAAGAAFSVTVTALDQYNNVASGYRGTVHFSSTDTRATLPANYTFTAADSGVHTYTNGVTQFTAGNQTISVTDGTLNASAATAVQPGAATSLQLSGVPSTIGAGTAFSVTVTALDQYNNVASGYQAMVRFTSTDAGATLPAAYTFTAADAGVHTFTNGVTLITAGNQTISVTDGTLNASAATAVQPGAATSLQLTGVPPTVVAGTTFSVTVTALDQYNNVATGYQATVSFNSSDARATLPAAYTFTAADAGVHTFTNGVTLITAGSQTLSVTDGTLTASAGVTVTPAPAVALMITAPATVNSGTAFDITVRAVDPYGNTDVNYAGTISFSSSDPDPGVVLPPSYTFSATDQGSVYFPGGGTLITPGLQSITATDGAGITGSAQIMVTAGGFPNGPGSRPAARDAGIASALASTAPTVPGLSSAVGTSDRTIEPAPVAVPVLDHAQVDHYFAFPMLESYGGSNAQRDRDFPELLPQILAEILGDI
jgi:hypothetical protein